MPYIKPAARDRLWHTHAPASCGELNFSFCQLASNYILHHRQSYQNSNDIIGVLEGAKLEIYRRLVVKLEDKKCETNGDVFNDK